jgi:outer membrane protein assembly factor BamE (lipoprotein component of BamABCDE complex)
MICSILVLQSGCAMAKYGKANVTTFDITVPDGLVGQDKESIMKILGDPNFVATDKGTEYWGYNNHNGWFVYLFYIAGGKTESRDLILEFLNSKVKTAYLIDKGSAIGIFAPPMSVVN